MSYKVVILIGIFAMGVLLIIPPWKSHGLYAGHFRIDHVTWMEFDSKRFCLEQSIVGLGISNAIFTDRCDT